MAILYVTSLSQNAGKTMLCAGLGKNWLDSGKKVGYLKPLIPDTQGQPGGADKDALFMQKLLDLKEPVEALCPIINTPGEAGEVLKKAYQAVAQDKDIVIIDGLLLNITNTMFDTLNGQVLVVHDYSNPLSLSLTEYKKLGRRLLGVVVNKIPRKDIGRVQDHIADDLTQAGIKLWGLIPEDRLLMVPSVADLAEAVQGKILNNTDKSSELIENFMLGSSTFDRGAAYYNRKNNKAVILWGERPGFRKAALSNLQLAALQTSIRCIVISASGAPIPAVAQKADEKQVPLISAPGAVPDLVTAIEKAMGNLKFNQEKKLQPLFEILQRSFNFKQLNEGLGLIG